MSDDEAQDMGNVSDGYHTFNELYEHRHVLFLIVMAYAYMAGDKTWVDIDSGTPDWFLAGIDTRAGQISYHLPARLFPLAVRAIKPGYQRQPYDGYTTDDVLHRLQTLAGYESVKE